MLRLLADENIQKRLVALPEQHGVDVVRARDVAERGISDQELVNLANALGRAVLTRDGDFAKPWLRRLARYGVVYISYQPSRSELPQLAKRVAMALVGLEPRPGLLVVVGRGTVRLEDLVREERQQGSPG